MQHLSSASSNLETHVARFCWPFNCSLNSVTCAINTIPKVSWFASTREGTLGVGAVCIIVAVMLSCFTLVYKSASRSFSFKAPLSSEIVLEQKNFVLICSTKCFYLLWPMHTLPFMSSRRPISLIKFIYLTLRPTREEGVVATPFPRFFWVFSLDDEKPAACIFSSCLFILRTNFETRLAIVSYYGCEIWRHN